MDSISEDDLYNQIQSKQISLLHNLNLLNEKYESIENISKSELNNFKLKSKKYGSYLKKIQNEFFLIDDLIKKINKEIK